MMSRCKSERESQLVEELGRDEISNERLIVQKVWKVEQLLQKCRSKLQMSRIEIPVALTSCDDDYRITLPLYPFVLLYLAKHSQTFDERMTNPSSSSFERYPKWRRKSYEKLMNGDRSQVWIWSDVDCCWWWGYGCHQVCFSLDAGLWGQIVYVSNMPQFPICWLYHSWAALFVFLPPFHDPSDPQGVSWLFERWWYAAKIMMMSIITWI